MKKQISIGLLLLSNLLLPTRSNAQIVIAPQPYIGSSGVPVGPIKATASSCVTPPFTFGAQGNNDGLDYDTVNGGTVLCFNGVSYFQVDGGSNRSIQDLTFGSAGSIYWGNTTAYGSPTLRIEKLATGKFIFSDGSSDTHAVGLDVTTDGQAWFVTKAGADTAIVKANSLVSTGSVLATGNVAVGTTGRFWFGNATERGDFGAVADGVIQFRNNAATGFTRIILGTNDATTNGASWNLNSGVLESKVGDGSLYTSIKSLFFTPSQTIAGVANVGANSCGTTAATITGTSNSNITTIGATSGTQCRIAFTTAAPTAWDCVASDDTTTIAVRTTPVDTTHTDIIGTFTAGDKVTAICFPR